MHNINSRIIIFFISFFLAGIFVSNAQISDIKNKAKQNKNKSSSSTSSYSSSSSSSSENRSVYSAKFV